MIVTSAVGMDVNSSRADLLPGMLAAVLAGGPLPAGDGAAGAIWRLRAAIPPQARGALARALPDRAALELTARLELRGVDWSQTRAFAHPADNQGYVRLNLRGRERDGIVEPGEADELLARIAAGLRTFRDPDGQPAVAGIERVAEHHPGARCGQLPDLVVRWSDRPATTLAGARVRRVRRGAAQRRGQRALGQPHARRRVGRRRAGTLRGSGAGPPSLACPTSPPRSRRSAASAGDGISGASLLAPA